MSTELSDGRIVDLVRRRGVLFLIDPATGLDIFTGAAAPKPPTFGQVLSDLQSDPEIQLTGPEIQLLRALHAEFFPGPGEPPGGPPS